ncbi:MAG: ATP-binding protein [Anaerolineae bacterium]|jgi:signal transduction histidine kinase
MGRWMRRLLNPPEFEDPEKTRIAGLLNTILLGFIAFAIGYVILSPWLYRDPGAVLISGISATLLWFGAWRLLQWGHVRLAGSLFLVVLFVIISAVALFRGGLHAAAVTTYITVIFAAGLLLGRRAALVFALFCLVASLGMLWAELAGVLPEEETSVEPITAWIGLATNVVLALMLLSLAVGNIRNALERVRGQERELARSNRELESEVAERRRAEQALRQRTLELQERNQDLSAFAHTVAHDLRAPLGLIVGLADLLQKDQALLTSQELSQHLETIAEHGTKMDSLIDNLLLLAQVREVDVQPEPLEMSAIVAEAYSRLDLLAGERGAELSMPDTLPRALGYRPWIEQVWVNYLSNAIKYGGRPPRIEVGAEVESNGMVRFWVQDNGRGLAPEKQAQLFIPFARLGELHEVGHGLGLSIAQRIVERLGGEVGVESDGVPGRGSCFYFSLPKDSTSS